MSYELTPEQVERYKNFRINESPDSLPERKEFFLYKDGWTFSASVTPGQPESQVVRMEAEKEDTTIDDSNRMLQEAKEVFQTYVADEYGFWTQDEAERYQEATTNETERGGDPED